MSTSRKIALLGDSTIDNKHWAKVSVVEHLKQALGSSFVVNDLTNDGFTTSDCLNGAYRNKAVPSFPALKFTPLVEGALQIKESDFILLSVGGNDFREFLAKLSHATNMQKYFRDNFDTVLRTMQNNYLNILKNLRALNPKAAIILMTQYYPARKSDSYYRIYQFMDFLRKTDLGKECKDADEMAQKFLQFAYSPIFKKITAEMHPCIVADITSSLDPYNETNYACQIEPSIEGGKKIAHMISTLMNTPITPGMSYRFKPEFFIDQTKDPIDISAFSEWKPYHPKRIALLEAPVKEHKAKEQPKISDKLLSLFGLLKKKSSSTGSIPSEDEAKLKKEREREMDLLM